MAKVAIIGGGFSGLSAAAYVSAAGHEVHLFEKNETLGGRARQLKTPEGFLFDMGPSWYWMPDIFEKFFADFGHQVQDFYDLKKLDPSFEVDFDAYPAVQVPANFSRLCEVFESIEPGSGRQLQVFMDDAEVKYQTAMGKMVYLPGASIFEYMNRDAVSMLFRRRLFQPFSKHLERFFADPRLRSLMEFPVLFLGALPRHTPAMYSLMNYAGMKLGTWYPMGGFGKIIDAMAQLAAQNGSFLHCNAPVSRIDVREDQVCGLEVCGEQLKFDALIASADYEYVESQLLPAAYRNYSHQYWEKKTFAPSCLIFYVGLSKKIEGLLHHTLFLRDASTRHGEEIYQKPQWPTVPQFYVCCTSKTDPLVAPPGHENLFFLMPIAPGLEDTPELREKYFHQMMDRLEHKTGSELQSAVVFKKSYCIRDFVTDYHAFKGNAYGLANTLRQTAILKPKMRNKKLHNLFYTGQLTVPGPGVPPSLISGKIVAELAIKQLQSIHHEALV